MGPGGGAAPAAGGAAPDNFIPPGALGSLYRPSERPDEPVTSGAISGPGPGPESLLGGAALTGGAMASLLNRAAIASGSSSLRALSVQAAQQGK